MAGRTEVSAQERLAAFADAERERLDTRTGNIAAAYIGQLIKLLDYLDMTVADYDDAIAMFTASNERLRASLESAGSGSRLMADEELRLLVEGQSIKQRLHLRIETFYVFAKILLDKLARLFPNYFGQGRGVRLTKHSQLETALPRFAEQKGLTIPDSLTKQVEGLTSRVVSYRDDAIVHADNPRIVRGTKYLDSGREASIIPFLIHGRADDADATVDSETPTVLRPLVDSYVVELLDFLEANRDKAWNPRNA